MKLRNKIILIALIFVSMIAVNCTDVFAEYVIQVVPDGTAWKNINVSDAYDACQNLNTTYSTLGTTSLKAHLTTNADWYAVSLLTYSAYGNRNANNTTGNNSGIKNFGTNYTFTSSLMEGYTSSSYRTSLENAVASGSPYVETVKNATNRNSNQAGRGLLASEHLTEEYGSAIYENSTNYPVLIRTSLFGFAVGRGNWWCLISEGYASDATFRPAIWNK